MTYFKGLSIPLRCYETVDWDCGRNIIQNRTTEKQADTYAQTNKPLQDVFEVYHTNICISMVLLNKSEKVMCFMPGKISGIVLSDAIQEELGGKHDRWDVRRESRYQSGRAISPRSQFCREYMHNWQFSYVLLILFFHSKTPFFLFFLDRTSFPQQYSKSLILLLKSLA